MLSVIETHRLAQRPTVCHKEMRRLTQDATEKVECTGSGFTISAFSSKRANAAHAASHKEPYWWNPALVRALPPLSYNNYQFPPAILASGTETAKPEADHVSSSNRSHELPLIKLCIVHARAPFTRSAKHTALDRCGCCISKASNPFVVL